MKRPTSRIGDPFPGGRVCSGRSGHSSFQKEDTKECVRLIEAPEYRIVKCLGEEIRAANGVGGFVATELSDT